MKKNIYEVHLLNKNPTYKHAYLEDCCAMQIICLMDLVQNDSLCKIFTRTLYMTQLVW